MRGRSSVQRVLFCLVVAALAFLPTDGTGARGEETEFSYADYAAVLGNYVDDGGMVDYRGLKANRAPLDAFVTQLAALERETYEEWGDEDKIAFWINAYNALTLRVIVDHHPIKPRFLASLRYPDNSIRQIKGVWDEIEFRAMGRPMTLEEIEHEVLREEFDEPRIHVALVCAAMGCPPLLNEPYTGDELDAQFRGRVRLLLRNPGKFRIDRRRGTVHVSPIFEWFGEDFVQKYGTDSRFGGHGRSERAVLNYLSDHVPDRDRRYLLSGEYRVRYLDYDWSLNEQE